jgi:hypothetical protein
MKDDPKNRTFFPLLRAAVLFLLLTSPAAAQDMFSPKLDLESAVSRA